MKALTVWQPWAAWIVSGEKDVENRGWATGHRGLLVIHAGKRDPHGPLNSNPMPLRALIGVVDVVDVVRNHPSRWAVQGSWHWVLERPLAFAEPIPYRGSPKIFDLDPQLELRVKELLDQAGR